MQNRLFPRATGFAPLMSALTSRLRGAKAMAPEFTGAPSAQPDLYLSIAVQDETADDSACRTAQARGQFLARQERWQDLAREIRDADEARSTTPGGMPLAELLAYGARSDVILAVEHALSDGRNANTAPITDGIKALEAMHSDTADNPMTALIVALAHIDIAWAWRGTVNDKRTCIRFSAHLDRAIDLLTPYDAVDLDSPALAAAQCALLTRGHIPTDRAVAQFEALIDLAPQNYRHMRAFGVHVLRSSGALTGQNLDLQARRIAARTRDIWGLGGYAWVNMDAIAISDQACAQIDTEFFIDAIRDIAALYPQQQMINLLAAWCSVALPRNQGRCETSRRRIAGCADWLIRDHLTEIHPLIWAHAAAGFDNSLRVTSPATFAARGRAVALRVIADQFRDDIDAGHRIAFTPHGPVSIPV